METLSDRIFEENSCDLLDVEAVKSFIEQLKVHVGKVAEICGIVFPMGSVKINQVIDKLAGEKLI